MEYLIFIPLLCYALLVFYIFFKSPRSLNEETASHADEILESELPIVTILIAMRNEEQNIAETLSSILAQDYPRNKFKVLVLDDHSEDKSAEIVRGFESEMLELLSLPDSIRQKKNAIKYGISKLDAEYVLMTDADCTMGKSWLRSHVRTLLSSDTKPDFIAAAVHFNPGNTIFGRLQYFEMAVMMYLTRRGLDTGFFNIANAANMFFKTAVFRAVQDELHTEIASGDDAYLVAAIGERRNYSTQFNPAKEAIVWTDPILNFRGFFSQRFRWASKSKSMKKYNILFIQAIVFLAKCFLFLSILPSLFLQSPLWIYYFLGLLAIDVFQLFQYRHTLNFRLSDIFLIPLTSLYHAGYVSIIGIATIFKTEYVWKGRKVK